MIVTLALVLMISTPNTLDTYCYESKKTHEDLDCCQVTIDSESILDWDKVKSEIQFLLDKRQEILEN